MDGEALAMIIVIPTFVTVTGWTFKTFLTFVHNRQLTKLHYALQNNLLDKLGNSPEAIEYLHSDAAEKMFAFAAKERTNPYARILTAMQTGAVIGLLGIGFLVLRPMVPHEGAEAFAVVGVLALALGLGFLASSFAAYTFSKKWGLVNGDSEDA